MRQTASVIAICLVPRQRLQSLIRLPAFNALDRDALLDQPVIEHGCHSARLEDDLRTRRSICEKGRDHGRLRPRFTLSYQCPFTIKDTNVRLFH